jgi:capsule polysaccharide export protein KpsC/LpsZ
MQVVNRKQFNKLLKETIKDFESTNNYKVVENLKEILNTKNIKDLTISQISPLIELIIITELQPALHAVDYQIKKEHKKMKKYINQFFDYQILQNSEIEENFLLMIQKKGAENE